MNRGGIRTIRTISRSQTLFFCCALCPNTLITVHKALDGTVVRETPAFPTRGKICTSIPLDGRVGCLVLIYLVGLELVGKLEGGTLI